MNFRCAAKALIYHQGSILVIKRRPNDVHRPAEWDIPGGRMEPGENPYDALAREAREEIKMDIEIILPIEVQHFVRQDGQKIALTIFLCTAESDTATLSEEHTEYRWLNLQTEKNQFPAWIQTAIEKLVTQQLLKAINS